MSLSALPLLVVLISAPPAEPIGGPAPSVFQLCGPARGDALCPPLEAKADRTSSTVSVDDSFRWTPALGSTFLLITLQTAARLEREQTRAALEGPFFNDWMKSASALFDPNWNDGNKWVTNYIAHPIGGSMYAHIARLNDPRYRTLKPGDQGYGTGVLRWMGYTALASLLFEIGPISEASVGNVGLENPDQQGLIDPVITPTLGTLWLVLEDVVAIHVLSKIENEITRNVLQVLLNPGRSMANVFSGRWPWRLPWTLPRPAVARANSPSR